MALAEILDAVAVRFATRDELATKLRDKGDRFSVAVAARIEELTKPDPQLGCGNCGTVKRDSYCSDCARDYMELDY